MSILNLITIYELNDPASQVVFKVQPEISESKNVNYIEVSEIRQAASILIFIGSPGRQFNLNVKLVSRTEAEATKNFEYLHRMKSWGMPKKGESGPSGDSDVPPTLALRGYVNNFKNIRMVLKSMNAEYPTDCDYITASNGTQMPIIMPITLSFQETRSADELKRFNFENYRAGELSDW